MPEPGTELAEQQAVGIKEQVVGEHAADTQAEKLDGPALGNGCVAIEHFHQPQATHGQGQVAGEQNPGDLRRRKPMGRQVGKQHQGGGQGVERQGYAGQPTLSTLHRGQQLQQEGKPEHGLQRLGKLYRRARQGQVGLQGQHQGPDRGAGTGRQQQSALQASTPAGHQHQRQ